MTTYRVTLSGISHFNGAIIARCMTINAKVQSAAEEIATIRSMSYLTIERIDTTIMHKDIPARTEDIPMRQYDSLDDLLLAVEKKEKEKAKK